MNRVVIVGNIISLSGKEESLFHRSDFKIINVASNEDALAQHRAESVDLIVTRLNMPGMAGDELCGILRDDRDLCHVSVMLVGSDSPADLERGLRARANAYLTQPIDYDQLLSKLVELLNISKRESFRVLVSATVFGSCNNLKFLCNLVNISATGMLIEAGQTLSVGDRILCEFFLPSRGMVHAEGVIVRSASRGAGLRGYGIRFTQVPSDSKASIEAFIQLRLKSP